MSVQKKITTLFLRLNTVERQSFIEDPTEIILHNLLLIRKQRILANLQTCWRFKGCHLLLSRSVVSNSLRPRGLPPARFLGPWGFSRQEYWSGLPCPPPGDRILYLLSQHGSPKNTGVSSLSLLQGIFLTHEWNWALRHCRQILYQLSYQGSLSKRLIVFKCQQQFLPTCSKFLIIRYIN